VLLAGSLRDPKFAEAMFEFLRSVKDVARGLQPQQRDCCRELLGALSVAWGYGDNRQLFGDTLMFISWGFAAAVLEGEAVKVPDGKMSEATYLAVSWLRRNEALDVREDLVEGSDEWAMLSERNVYSVRAGYYPARTGPQSIHRLAQNAESSPAEPTLRCAGCGAEYITGTVICPECMSTDRRPIN
jgi:hypothetical protein